MGKQSMTKRVAVLISGQPRAYEQGFAFLNKNLLSNPELDVDIFIHTWRYNFIDYGKLINLYKPKIIRIEEELPEYFYKQFPRAIDPVNHPIKYTFSAFYSVYHSWLMFDKFAGEYDLAIKTRFDYAFTIPEFDAYPIEINSLYVPGCRLFFFKQSLPVNDQFAFGSPYVISRYCQTYKHLSDFNVLGGIPMNGEEMLAENLKRHDLVDKIVYIDPHYLFPPGPYNGTPHNLIRSDMDLWIPKNDFK